MHRGWSSYTDKLRDDIWTNYQQINLKDFDFYDLEAFNQCENNNAVLMAVENWSNIHPLIKVIPVEWDYTIPFGLLYSSSPTKAVSDLLSAIKELMK